MTHAAPLRILCVTLLSVCGTAHAAGAGLSEHLADWQRAATAKIASVVSNAQAPLILQTSNDIGQSIIRQLVLLKGRAMLGTTYAYGSNQSDAVDCSALIQQLFENAGIELPRTTHDLARVGEPVSRKSLQPGDLLFYRWRKHGLHVAIYAGDGQVIHASPGEGSVVVTELNKTWNRHFVAARRIMSDGDV